MTDQTVTAEAPAADPNEWIEIHHPDLPGTGTVVKKRRSFEHIYAAAGWVEGPAVEPRPEQPPTDEAFTPSGDTAVEAPGQPVADEAVAETVVSEPVAQPEPVAEVEPVAETTTRRSNR